MRRKPGALLPLEVAILDAGLELQGPEPTRFHGFQLAKAMQERQGARRLTAHGTLYKALGPIATNGLNLTKIESRPARERPWDYYFYADVEGDPADPRYHSAITELQEYCIFVNVLGAFHVLNSARAVEWAASRERAGGMTSDE